jgi:spore maturation protein CgeB
MHILFVGPIWRGSTSLQRLTAYKDLGHTVTSVDTTFAAENGRVGQLFYKLLRKFEVSPEIFRTNRKIRQCMQEGTWDMVWLDKATSVQINTIRQIRRSQPKCSIVFYSPDDMMLTGNQTRAYQKCLPEFDLYVTTKSYNVAELKELGASSVLFIDNAYDPYTHLPMALTKEEQVKWRAEVGFVDGFEEERCEMMFQLARGGISVTIRGPGWESYVNKHPNLDVQPGWVLDDNYARAISATKINLCFLRKVARDLQTTRSVEIPACGGFMLAERTEEHGRLFIEGQEAEFFVGIQELTQKTRYYLTHDAERERIAQAGRERCLKSGYSNQVRLSAVLEHLEIMSVGRSV